MDGHVHLWKTQCTNVAEATSALRAGVKAIYASRNREKRKCTKGRSHQVMLIAFNLQCLTSACCCVLSSTQLFNLSIS